MVVNERLLCFDCLPAHGSLLVLRNVTSRGCWVTARCLKYLASFQVVVKRRAHDVICGFALRYVLESCSLVRLRQFEIAAVSLHVTFGVIVCLVSFRPYFTPWLCT